MTALWVIYGQCSKLYYHLNTNNLFCLLNYRKKKKNKEHEAKKKMEKMYNAGPSKDEALKEPAYDRRTKAELAFEKIRQRRVSRILSYSTDIKHLHGFLVNITQYIIKSNTNIKN